MELAIINIEHIGYLRMIMILNYNLGEWVAPPRIETGRYVDLPVSERICPFCKNIVETGMHVLLKCPLYSKIRQVLYEKAKSLDDGFHQMCDDVKFVLHTW